MTEPPGGAVPDDAPYEQLVAALERLTAQMASDSIGIEEAADLYEKAGRLYTLAAERLARVQERIDQLSVPEKSGGSAQAG